MSLLEYSRNIHSQFGEDGVLARIFELLEIPTGVCVEFGAWDGVFLSNTCALIEKGWTGVLIEGDPDKFTELLKRHAGNNRVLALNAIVDFTKNKLDDILTRMKIAKDFDLLSIDVDGNDYHLWNGVRKYTPKVVVIEYNPSIPNHIEFVQAADLKVYQGCGVLNLVKLAKTKGYELACCTEVNAVFVRSDLFGKLGVENNTLDKLRPWKRCETYILQLFDGTLKLAGQRRMIWHGYILDEEKIQMLPPEKRKYPQRLQ